MWCTTTRWRRTTESTSFRASATQTRTRPTLSRDKEVGHFGTSMGHFGTFMGHFGTFTTNPFQGHARRWNILGLLHPALFRAKRWDIFGLLWDILGLLNPTFFRAKEVGHFRTFSSSPFQGQGGWAFLYFYVHPFLGPRGSEILDIRNFLMQTFLRPKSKDINCCIQPF